jgi:hypothetical protein
MMLPTFKANLQVIFCKAVEDFCCFCFHIFYQQKTGFLSIDLFFGKRQKLQGDRSGK